MRGLGPKGPFVLRGPGSWAQFLQGGSSFVAWDDHESSYVHVLGTQRVFRLASRRGASAAYASGDHAAFLVNEDPSDTEASDAYLSRLLDVRTLGSA